MKPTERINVGGAACGRMAAGLSASGIAEGLCISKWDIRFRYE